MFMRCFILAVILLSSSFSDVFAQNQEAQSPVDIFATVRGFTHDMSMDDKEHFYHIYGNYNMISTVNIVRDDVGGAIKACVESNVDMADDLTERYGRWDGEISTSLEEAKGHLDNMVIAQSYVDADGIRGIFELVDAARERKSVDNEKTPVSTKEACTFLLEKMDKTQVQMLGLLRATLVSYPQK